MFVLLKIKFYLAFFLLITTTVQVLEAQADIKFQQKIQMHDGINLSADIFFPVNPAETMPVLFVMTPYGTDRVHNDGIFFAKNGYILVAVDCRGRGNSEGEFIPFEYEGRDGYDVIKWIAGKEWCNGKVGMFGGSYLGMIQWLVMKENPPALRSVIPSATVCPGIDFPIFNNIYYTYNTQWLTFVKGKTTNTNSFTDHKYWNYIFRKLFVEFTPYFLLDEVSGFKSPIFKKWLDHPYFDDYYQNILPSQQDYPKINIPILTITGHFDDDQPGTLYYYRNFMEYGAARAKEKCYMVIGPWDHGGTRRPNITMGNLRFSDNSKIDMDKLYLEWFDWTLKDGKKPDFLKEKIACYEMGTDEWKFANKLENLTNQSIKYYISSENRNPHDIYNSGILSQSVPKNEKPDKYFYNPLDTAFATEKIQDKLIDFCWRDEKESFYPDKLVYHTPPVEKDFSIAGNIILNAYISMNVPDTDFEAILFEMKPDGSCVYLTSAIARARHRKSISDYELVKTGDINLYKINSFHYFARRISKGSRLRLVFGALNSPYYQKNYNTGNTVSFETRKDAKTAEVLFYHDSKYPSSLEIPVKE